MPFRHFRNRPSAAGDESENAMKQTLGFALIGAGFICFVLTPGCETPDPRPFSMNHYPQTASSPAPIDRPASTDLGRSAPATTPNAMESMPPPEFPLPSSDAPSEVASRPPVMDSTPQANFAGMRNALAQEPSVAPGMPAPATAPPENKPAAMTGHAADYSWLYGEVHYDHISRGWRLRYAGLDEIDRWGGAVILAGDSSVERLKEGQIVKVQGRLLQPANAKSSPGYRVDSITVIDTVNH
jgi:hypothetical protein